MSAAASQSDIYAAGDLCGQGGSYQVIRLISKGGMGEVYEVAHRATGGRYALKRLQFQHVEDDAFLAKIKAEAAAGKEMKHPNLVPVYESALDRMGGYFIMEYLDGETLADRLRRGAMPPLEALEVAIQVADALHALHLAGIFHRDVKPANIFLVSDGRIMLLDLGAAKFERYGMNTTRGQPIGTALFMSPEHAHNNPVDGRSDIFSLGHVLYLMFTGGHAYEAHGDKFATATPLNIVMWHSMEDCPPLTKAAPHLPRMLWDVVRVAVERDRERRYDTASSFAATMRGAAKVLRGEAETSATRAAANHAPAAQAALAPSPAAAAHAPPIRPAAPSAPPTASPAASRAGPKGTEMMMSAPERFDAPSAVPRAVLQAVPRAVPRAVPPAQLLTPPPVQWGHSPPPPAAAPPAYAPPAAPAPQPTAAQHAPATPSRDARPSPAPDDRPLRPLFPQDFSYQPPQAMLRATPGLLKRPAEEGMSTGQKIGAVFVSILTVAALAVIAYILLKGTGRI